MTDSEGEIKSGEYILLLMFIGISSYMLIDAFSFPNRAAQFPQITAVLTIVGSLLLLFRRYLPRPVHNFVTGNPFSTERIKEDTENLTKDEIKSSGDSPTEVEATGRIGRPVYGREINPSLFAGILTTLYISAGYLVGLAWVTPIFLLIYTMWFEKPWYTIVSSLIFSIIVMYFFSVYLDLEIGTGVLGGMEL